MNHVRTAQQPVINSRSEEHLRTLFDCTLSKPQIISRCKCFFYYERSSFSETGRPPKKTQWLPDLSLIGFGSPRGFDVEEKEKKSGQHFSAGLSKLDQTTHRGCNYDQPAGMFLDTGWAATWGPQLLTCNRNTRLRSLETQIVPEINTQ